MKAKYFMPILLLGFLFAACSSDKANEVPESCTYNYNDAQTTLEWTAYKFTSNSPVKGTFNTINVSTVSDAASIEELISSIGFTIPISSLETQDELKNNNIIDGFFKTMNTSVLNGNVVEVKGDEVVFEVELNGIKQKVNGRYSLIDDVFSYTGVMNLNLFDSAKAIKALNDKCGDNHKGEDGVVKVSETVDIKFTTRLKKTCK